MCSENLNPLLLQPIWLGYLQHPVLLGEAECCIRARKLRDYPGLESDNEAPANEHNCI